MKKEIIVKLHNNFDAIANEKNGVEYWMARELQELLEYAEWRNFLQVVEKAKTACLTAGQAISDHFVDVNKMVSLGSGSERNIDDVMLTRYACYLIAQNGDSRKEAIAFAQSYFAIQTRKQEILERRIALLLIFRKLGILFVGNESYKAKGTREGPLSSRISDLAIALRLTECAE